MAEILIQAEPREPASSNQARRLRRDRRLPAVLYGGDKEAHAISLDPREIINILKSDSGENTIFKVKVGGGAAENVMIFEVQIDPITHSLQHADLVRIEMDEEIEVEVPIKLVGEPVGVKADGGVLDHSLRELTIECLPGDIPEQLEIDVGGLKIHDSIRVADIVVPPGIRVVTDLSRTVASVVPPVSEEELVTAVEPLEGEVEPALVGAEGEEAPTEEAAEGAPKAEQKADRKKEEEGD